MKTAKRLAAQGDVVLVRVDKLPDGLAERKGPEAAVIAHSETGHHHTAEGPGLRVFDVPGDPFRAYVVAKGPIDVVHHRAWDTHETLRMLAEVPAGSEVIWEIRRQREHSPEGWRRVED